MAEQGHVPGCHGKWQTRTQSEASLMQQSNFCWTLKNLFGLALRQSTALAELVLHLLVDTTGIKFLGESEGKCKKHGPERHRQWRKLHIGIDAQTLQIRAICVTSSNASDAAVIPDLLQQLPDDEVLESLTGDGAYDTQAVHEEVIKRGGIPIIPPRKNARIGTQDELHQTIG